jgi:hypothetical protein
MGRSGVCLEEAAGWEDRVKLKAISGSAVGAFAGLVLSVVRHRPVMSTTLFTALSTGTATCVFGGFQEGFRMLTCKESPVNSVFAGCCAGYMLGLLQHGRGKGPPVAAATFAALGGLCHHLDDRGISASDMARSVLQALDLLDPVGGDDSASVVAADDDGDAKWFERWLPIRKLTEEEFVNVTAQHEVKDAYGTGKISTEDFHAKMEKLLFEAAMIKHQRRLSEQEERNIKNLAESDRRRW